MSERKEEHVRLWWCKGWWEAGDGREQKMREEDSAYKMKICMRDGRKEGTTGKIMMMGER